MIISKKLFSSLIIASFSPLLQGKTATVYTNPTTQKSTIVLYVDSAAITEADIRGLSLLKLMSIGETTNKDLLAQIKTTVINELITMHLQIQMATKIKLKVSQNELTNALEVMAKDNNTNWTQMRRHFTSQGINPTLISNMIKAQILWRQYIQGRFGSRVRISDAQVEAFKKRLGDNQKKHQVNMSEIVISDKMAGSAGEALKTSQMVYGFLKGLADFNLVAKKYSHAPSKENGGRLGWVATDSLELTIKNFIDQSNIGDISKPIRSNGQYIIYRINDKKGPGQTSMDQVQMGYVQVNVPYKKWEDSQEKLEAIINDLINETSSVGIKKIAKTHNFHTEVISQRPLNELLIPSSLIPMMLKAEIGKCLPPLNTGEELMMFWVSSRKIDPRNEEVIMKNAEIKDQLTQEGLAKYAASEINKLRSSAFIRYTTSKKI